MESAAASGVGDPVDCQSEEEEGNKVEGFVVHVWGELQRCEAQIGGA